MGQLINGLKIADKINKKTALGVRKLKSVGFCPKLAVVLVGEDRSSVVYVHQKEKIAQKVGLDFVLHKFPSNIKKEELINNIQKIQQDKKLAGLIIQLPLPEKLYCPEVLNQIEERFDVDFLNEISMGKIMMNTNKFIPPTPGATLAILEDLKIDLQGKNVTIVGMGTLVGRPLSMLLLNKKASITTINTSTKDVKNKCLQADIIVSCAGKKDLLRGDMIKKSAVVIDAGFSFFEGKSYGDVNLKEALEKADYVTPTPGGVGPVTVALLLYNTLLRAKDFLNKK